MREVTFYLKPIPPFRLDLTVWALRRHPNNKIDNWNGEYRRLFIIEGNLTEIVVMQTGDYNQPELLVRAIGETLPGSAREAITAFLASLLGLNIALT
ncbi:MAG TPA: DNA-3-methyladenine glycosylase 2 family protein, partial [Anaerolineae bacterium]|nr:DNA-3-methyladenine glycosylase 2 family protein [Anaerolineae bacterium]